MAFTTVQLAALEAAISQGTTQVQYSDKRVTYRSLTEMMALRELMKRELGLSNPSKRIYAEFDNAVTSTQDD